MKTRHGFVSNSSSTSFIIGNVSDKELTIVDFVKENPQLLVEFKNRYGWHKRDPRFTKKLLIASAQCRLNDEKERYTFPPHSSKGLIFGDEQGDTIGDVFDYILRDGGASENFNWQFSEMLR